MNATANEPVLVRCPNCGKMNRVRAAASGVPHCGNCGATLPWLVRLRWTTAVVEACVVAVVVLLPSIDLPLDHLVWIIGTAAVANAAVACGGGQCGIASCTTGYADCNTTFADGCEVSLPTDVDNCGTCNNVCPTPLNGVAETTPGTGATRLASAPPSATPRPPASMISTCGLAEMILSRMPSWKPVITASTTMSALTPRKTPPMPIQTKSERLVLWPRARR